MTRAVFLSMSVLYVRCPEQLGFCGYSLYSAPAIQLSCDAKLVYFCGWFGTRFNALRPFSSPSTHLLHLGFTRWHDVLLTPVYIEPKIFRAFPNGAVRIAEWSMNVVTTDWLLLLYSKPSYFNQDPSTLLASTVWNTTRLALWVWVFHRASPMDNWCTTRCHGDG